MTNGRPWGLVSGALAVVGIVILLVGAFLHIDLITYLGVIIFVAGAATYRFMGI